MVDLDPDQPVGERLTSFEFVPVAARPMVTLNVHARLGEDPTEASINTITTVSPAVTIVSSIIWGIIADAYDAKVPLITVMALLNIFASVVLAIWNVPVVLKYFAFFLSGTADAIAAMIYAWANEICAGNAEERALVISSMNTVGNTFGAWLPLL